MESGKSSNPPLSLHSQTPEKRGEGENKSGGVPNPPSNTASKQALCEAEEEEGGEEDWRLAMARVLLKGEAAGDRWMSCKFDLTW